MQRPVAAIDLGGTHLRSGVVFPDGRVTALDVMPSPQGGPAALIEALGAAVERAVAVAGTAIQAVCAGIPGFVDAAAGRVLIAPNIAGIRDLQLRDPLQARLGVPVLIENDASAAALGEYRFGAGRGTRHLLHATLGTGIGGGIVIEGRLYRGARGMAGDIGHIVMDTAGPVCVCGSRGCLEALASGTALGHRAAHLAASGRSPRLSEIAASGRQPTGRDLYQAAVAGDQLAEAEIRHAGHLLGLGFGSLVNVLNPDAITLSGGMLVMGDMYLGPMRQAFASIAYGPASTTEIRLSSLGADTGILGAAAVAFEELAGGAE